VNIKKSNFEKLVTHNSDDDTKTQCNQLNTSPLQRGNASKKNGPARVKRWMQWEAPPSKPLAVGQEEWSSTGKTADAVGSAFQTAGR